MDELNIQLMLDKESMLKLIHNETVTLNVKIDENLNMKIDIKLED
jgi:hypothetical protein